MEKSDWPQIVKGFFFGLVIAYIMIRLLRSKEK